MNDVFNPAEDKHGPHRYPIAGKVRKEEHEHGSLNGALDMDSKAVH